MKEVLYICTECLERYSEPLEQCPKDGAPLRRFSLQHEDPMIGSILDERWIIEDKIGEGGMGAVYRAQQVSVNRKVAIKTMHSKLADGEGKNYLERFLSEANLASKINHPHLVSIHDFGQTPNGVLYIVMEYLDGLSLADVLQQTQLNLHQALTIAIQLCQALSAAHQSKVVHRDLKPENIFLLQMPDNDIFIKVLDFGIAKNLDTQERITQTGQVFGTPEYMSPEQCRGSSKIDQRSDLYALGCILYELIGGHPPFQDESMLKVLFKHVSDDYPPLLAKDELTHGHDDLIALIDALLQKKQRNRPVSANQVRKRLEKLLQHPNTKHIALPAWYSQDASIPSEERDTLEAGVLAGGTSDAEDLSTTPAHQPRPFIATQDFDDPPPIVPESKPEPAKQSMVVPVTLGVLLILGLVVGAFVMGKSQQSTSTTPTPQETNTQKTLASKNAPNASENKASENNITSPIKTDNSTKDNAQPSKTPPKTSETSPAKKPAKRNILTRTNIPEPKSNEPEAKKTPLALRQKQPSHSTQTNKTTKPKTRQSPRTSKKRKLSSTDQTRVMFGKRPRVEINKQSAQLGRRFRPCIDAELKRGNTISANKKGQVKVVSHYVIMPDGRVDGYFIDPNKTSKLPPKVISCIKAKAAAFRFKSDYDITTKTMIKAQHSNFTISP